MRGEARQGFEGHWKAHASVGISPTKELEARGFLGPVIEQVQRTASPMRILDVGCGDGVHAVVLAKYGVQPHHYYGVDLSYQAVQLAGARLQAIGDDSIQFQAGSALCLPFRAQSFDVVFSYGVVGYTGAAEVAIGEMVRVCRPGGLIGVWVYPRLKGVFGNMFAWARAVCSRLGTRFSKVVVYGVVPFLPVLPVRSGTSLLNSTWAQCVEVVEVNLLPRVLEFYTPDEVLGWFRRRNLEITYVDADRPIAVWARA